MNIKTAITLLALTLAVTGFAQAAPGGNAGGKGNKGAQMQVERSGDQMRDESEPGDDMAEREREALENMDEREEGEEREERTREERAEKKGKKDKNRDRDVSDDNERDADDAPGKSRDGLPGNNTGNREEAMKKSQGKPWWKFWGEE